MDPVTQHFALSWKPKVRYWERRLEPLRVFEERQELASFNVQRPEVVARIANRYQEVRYGSVGVSVWAADQEVDLERIFGALKTVFDVFEPGELGSARANFQFLIPVSADYDEVRRDIGQGFLS